MRMVLTFKSGAQVRADVEEFTTRKDDTGTEFVQLKWTTPARARVKLHSLLLGEIACVHVEYDDKPGPELPAAGGPSA